MSKEIENRLKRANELSGKEIVLTEVGNLYNLEIFKGESNIVLSCVNLTEAEVKSFLEGIIFTKELHL